MDRIVHWRGTDEWRAEVAQVSFLEDGLRARGVQLGVDPLPYRLDYTLDAPESFVTRRLRLEASGAGWGRTLLLERDPAGAWSCETTERGEASLGPPGGPTDDLEEALDCDLGFSPLTNLMPVRRAGLDGAPGAEDFLMAWVSVPDLELFADAQRYEHVSVEESGSVVRFVDRGRFEGFTAELRLDRDGLAARYPGLAQRVDPPNGQAAPIH
jgi:hypothetical protein